MRAHWAEYGPPANVSLAGIAQVLGVKFGGGSSPSPAHSTSDTPAADPFAIQSLIGQAEVTPYKAPRTGMIV